MNKATLVERIESDDPSIKIAFGDGELQFAGAYKQPITALEISEIRGVNTSRFASTRQRR